MSQSRTIVGVGEALFDLFPDSARLGGAPLNMAVHAHQLGNRGLLISRIGQDDLGRRLQDELRHKGMSLDHLQTDPDHPTGTVVVDFDADGEPTFDIIKDVAWDYLQYDYDCEDVAQMCDAVCFGSLAQRIGQTRNTIYRLLSSARRGIRLFDVNLRQTCYDRRVLSRSMELATAVKLNSAELATLRRMFNLPEADTDAARKLIQQFDLKWLAVTRGAEGTAVITPNDEFAGKTVDAKNGGDAVGAGDATAAALLHGATRRWDWPRTIKLANALGAHVAGQAGACPELNDEIKALAE